MKKICVLLTCFIFLSLSLTVFAGEEKKEEKPSVKAYGYIKLDALYETGRSSHGNFAIWASDPGETDGLFHVTAKETRLGFAIKGFSFGDYKVTGKIEVDFHSSSTENKAYNYMRHAFLKISNGSFTIIAGQTWDIISPLNAATLNYPVLWGAGNIGYRRPQLSIRSDMKSGKNVFTIQAGIFRTISLDYDGDGVDDGVTAGLPTFQARIAGKFSLSKNSYLQLGVSGHYGKSKSIGGTLENSEAEYTSNSVNVDFLWVFSPKFKIVAEFFSGKNLGTFLGGIAQHPMLSIGGPDGAEFRDVKAKGFFVNLVANPTKKVRLSAGIGMDDPDEDEAPILRKKNMSVFGNILINLSRSVKVGFEVSHWETDYSNYYGLEESHKTLRLQNSWILSF